MQVNSDRHILHMDLDTFFVSVERLLNSALVGQPVIIGGGSDRGVVASCSYEARAFGVHSAMPMKLARQLCPDAIQVRGDMESYSKFSRMVTDIIEEKAPVVEKASIDEHYLDLTGMDKFYGCYKWSTELRTRIMKETGLPISFGLSVNKTVSKIATGEAKPCGEKNVLKDEVKPFINPLSIKKIPMLGPKSYTLLRSMGVDTIKTLSEVPPELMQRVLGENGLSIWNKANGVDFASVEPYRERKSISAEQTFEQDTIDLAKLKLVLAQMVNSLCFQLRKEGWLVSVVAVKIRYSNFDTHTQQLKINYTSLDHVIMKCVNELFDKLYNRRMLIRLVGIRFSGLLRSSLQIDLFEDSIERVSLYQAMDAIRKRFGEDKLMPSHLIDKRNKRKFYRG